MNLITEDGGIRRLTLSLNDTNISDNMALANEAAPSAPSSAESLVLLVPGRGHFANTTTAPPTHVESMCLDLVNV